MSWTRCVASMVLRLREGALSTQQTLPSSPGGRAGFPALSRTQARLLTPPASSSSPGLCVHCGRRAAPGCHRSSCCDVPTGVYGTSGVCFPACPGWNPGIVGWSVFHQACFRPHQQWCEGPAGLQPCQHLGSPVFSS